MCDFDRLKKVLTEKNNLWLEKEGWGVPSKVEKKTLKRQKCQKKK